MRSASDGQPLLVNALDVVRGWATPRKIALRAITQPMFARCSEVPLMRGFRSCEAHWRSRRPLRRSALH